MKNRLLSSMTFLSALYLSAVAVADVSYARNAGMGNTGVASSHYDAAALYNPALLTNKEDRDSFSVILPSVSVLASDKDEVIDTLDDVSDDFDLLEQQIDGGFDVIARETKDRIVADLQAVSDKPVTLNAGVAFAVAVPGEAMGYAVDVRSSANVAVLARFDNGDDARIDQAILMGNSDLDAANLQSSAKAVGAWVTEVVFSFAKRLSIGGFDTSIGIAPKYQNVETILYVERANDYDSDDFDADEFTRDDSNLNLDAGVALFLSDQLTVGARLSNLIGEKYSTIVSPATGETDTFEISPVVTAAVAYDTGWFTAAADLDLLPTKTFRSQDDSQFLSAGVEFNASDWAQLRLGAKVDLESTREDTVTVGIGLSPFDVFHLGLTGIVGSNDTYGGVVELKFTL